MTRHPFDGHRVYNGQPDDTMQKRINSEREMLADVQKLHPGACVTYFPMEGQWQVHVWGRPLSGMHNSKMIALSEALRSQ